MGGPGIWTTSGEFHVAGNIQKITTQSCTHKTISLLCVLSEYIVTQRSPGCSGQVTVYHLGRQVYC
jgi:hypothetical protein